MILTIINLVIIPILLGIIISNILKKEDKILNTAILVFISNILFNVIIFVLGQELIIFSVFNTLDYMLLDTFTITLLMLLIEWFMYTSKCCKLYLYKKSTFILGAITTITLIYFGWLVGSTGRVNFARFMYNFIIPINTDVADFYLIIMKICLYCLLMLSCLFIIYKRYKDIVGINKTNKESIGRKLCLAAKVFIILIVIVGLSAPVYAFHLEQAYGYFFGDDKLISDKYVSPNSVRISFPKDKRNLVFIFMESYESTYFDKDSGGVFDGDRLPNIKRELDNATNFSHSDKYGGANTMENATWTIAGMVTTLGGVNSFGYEGFEDNNTMPGIISLGDILEAEDYNQTFIIGEESNLYSIGPFFKNHGNNKIIGYETKLADGSLPKDYKEWWGFEDKKLYQFAKEEITSLSKEEKPFALTIATNDTHPEGGYIDKSCKEEFSSHYENSIACGDQLLGEFLTWIKDQPFYDQTTIVIVGDHLTTEKEIRETYETNLDRKVFNMIINGASPYKDYQTKNRQFYASDMFPTTLSALGVEIEGDKLGLGTNLYSNEKTIIEESNLEEINNRLERQSLYYKEEFVFKKNTYKKMP
ncbi:MAG: LTA synthase family protein [Erysipelotrichaceae bacterium]